MIYFRNMKKFCHGSSVSKESACNAGDLDSSLGWEDPLEKATANPLWYSGLENSVDCIVHGVTKSQTQLRNNKTVSVSFLAMPHSLQNLSFPTRNLLLSHFSRVRLCATPETAAHLAPPSPGLSRQEHWSGLPFPSLMHKSEK